MRLRYRAGQFWKALRAQPTTGQLRRAEDLLGARLMALFSQMQPGEQAHSLEIYEQLLAQGETSPDLLAAALLHDVGKIRYPLQVWERSEIVIAKKLLPKRARQWGTGLPSGWKRPFVVAERHPEWGAEMAAQAGASGLTVQLIRRHQEKIYPAPIKPGEANLADTLLYRLQLLDDMG